LWVGEPTRLTTGSTRMSRVKNQPVLKFVNKFQPDPTRTRDEPGWLAGSDPF